MAVLTITSGTTVLTLNYAKAPESSVPIQNVPQIIPGRAGNINQRFSRESMHEVVQGIVKTQAEYDDFKSKILTLAAAQVATPCTASCAGGGHNYFNGNYDIVGSPRIKPREGHEEPQVLADWEIELLLRE